MRYEVGIYNEGVKDYELFFQKSEHAECAVRVAEHNKKKYNDIYSIEYIVYSEDDHRVYVLCDNIVLHDLLEQINYELLDYCDVDEDVDWDWL